jgi:hypothetical protein
MTTRDSAAAAVKTAARKAAGPAGAASPQGTQVVVLAMRKARGGQYQVLAPMTPTRHVSVAQLDAAVRLVLEPQ